MLTCQTVEYEWLKIQEKCTYLEKKSTGFFVKTIQLDNCFNNPVESAANEYHV